VYDYVDGKADWMAFGLPVEGEDGPYAGQGVAEVPTCRPDEGASDVAARLGREGADRAVVVNEHHVVVGVLEVATAGEAAPEASVLDVMDVSPSTVRPSVLLSSVAESDADQVLVTTSDGTLLGSVDPDAEPDEPSAGMERLEREFHDVVLAIEERFGDEEPSEEEVRSFLRERLMDEGRSAEEADQFLATMDDDAGRDA
jgi:CBS domain-containing protein